MGDWNSAVFDLTLEGLLLLPSLLPRVLRWRRTMARAHPYKVTRRMPAANSGMNPLIIPYFLLLYCSMMWPESTGASAMPMIF